EPAHFVEHLAAQGASELEAIHAADLWLACACARGVPSAAEELERAFFGELDRAVASLDSSASFADDVRQAIRERLYVRASGTLPGIATYTGEGPLSGWLWI